MGRKEEIEAQTDVRRRMLANGYVPLANKDKMCVLPAWPTLGVTEATIDQWSREWKWRGTGVRIEGGLVAIDLDVDNAEAVQAIIQALPEAIWNELQQAPVRRGKGAKVAWFCRLAEGEKPFYRLASESFAKPGEGEETVHRVEIFAGEGGGRQFGVYGAHTIEGGDVTVAYHWDEGRGLAEVPLTDLPVLTRAQLAAVADTATRALDALGWHPQAHFKAGYNSGAPIYDLDDQVFETRDHGPVDLEELTRLAESEGSVRLSASWLEGDKAVNPTRCIAYLHPRDQQVLILETASYNKHRPKALAPRTPSEDMVARMRAAAEGGPLFSPRQRREAPPVASVPAPTGEEVANEMEQLVGQLVATVAYCPSEQRCVMPIDAGPESAMTMANFKGLMAPYSVQTTGPRGGVVQTNPAAIWLADPRRVVVSGHRFRPDRAGERLVEDGGQLYINTYRELPQVEVSEADLADVTDAFEGLLQHLVPEVADRAWFRMWLASKVQAPAIPNCGVLMVAALQGTGRGTLFDMMQAAIGRQYYRSITSTELLGAGGQGAYTDWAAQTLLVTVEEVMAGADASGSMAWKRQEAYERVKQLVDPRQRAMEIRRKGLQNYSQEVFFSLLMATNHANALPLDHADRRIAVLIQPEVTLEQVPELKSKIDRFRAEGRFSETFGAALRTYLMELEVDRSQLRTAPELSGGREMMRHANEGDLEDIVRDVLGAIPGDFITNEGLRKLMQRAVQAHGEGDHLKNWWVRTQALLARPGDLTWRKMSTRQKYVVGGRVQKGTIYYRVAGAGPDDWANKDWHARAGALGVASGEDGLRVVKSEEGETE